MAEKINNEELKAMIANEIKEIGLHTVLNNESLNKIHDMVKDACSLDKAKRDIPELIPESADSMSIDNVGTMGAFPEVPVADISTGSTATSTAPVQKMDSASVINNGVPTDLGTSGNIPAYAVEVPDFIKQIEPGKVIIFSQNELSEGGENLSNKPLRTFTNPDDKKSMHELWMENGQMKAEVYMAKLEKIGDLEFNYSNGTTQFIEKRFNPDFEMQAKYKENPYMPTGPATPGQLDINGQPNLTAQIATSVDINQVVTDIVMNILRTQLLSNTTQAITHEVPAAPVGEFAKNFDTNAAAPMMEGMHLTMLDLVNNYNKVDTPEKLKEAIMKNDKSILINENKEVQEWSVDGKTYFTPVNKISIKKCYTNQ